MSRSSVCRVGFLCFLLTAFGLALPGCSKQGEGERCDLAANGSADCDEGLVCMKLDTDRCCPLQNPSDSRCNATPAPNNTGGASSSGGRASGGATSGGTGMGGTASAGASGGGGAPDSGEGGSGASGASSDVAGAGSGG